MSLLVINISKDLQPNKARQKIFTCFILSVYLAVNITYHRHNTIYNFISELIEVVVFAIIFFQLFGIYRRSSSVGNPISNNDIYCNSFPTL
jgi:hypothetical protein